MKVFYALKSELLEEYKQTKTDLLAARATMSAQDVSDAKEEILTECNIHDFDPDDTSNLYTVKNGTANIPIVGMLANKVNICSAFFGESVTTYKFIQEAVKAAEEDPQVNQLLFHADSGGGYVEGCDITAQVIAGCKKKKYAAVYNMSASACYWLISQCDQIISVSNTAVVGSIGVAAEIINRDKADEQKGITRKTLTNTKSKDKRPDYNTEEGEKILVDQLDDKHRVFTSSILSKREGRLSQKKIDDLSGKVLISQDALAYGLIDKQMSLSALDDYISNNSGASLQMTAMIENKPTPITGQNTEDTMTLQEFLAQSPDAKAKYEADIKAAELKGVEVGKAEMQKRIDATVNYIGNENYKGVEAIATKVLKGESDIAALEGAVAAFDMMNLNAKSDQAKDDTKAIGDTIPNNQSVSDNEIKNIGAQEDLKKVARYS